MAIKKWYSFAENGAYTGPEAAFFDVSQKQWAKMLEENHPLILEEFRKIIAGDQKDIIPYYNETLASKAENWTIFPLYNWGIKKKSNCEKCPETTKILESIPGMTNCLFSILKPGTAIKPHYGDSNVMYRCHLTLRSPGLLPEIGMRVKDQTTSWEAGRLIAFCDAHEHEVWNHTKEERWVLIVDVLREEFENDRKKICAEINATLWWQFKFQKSNLLWKVPRWGRKALLKATSWFF
jgi:aspartyl/asparaginyl beta-hydroxylase (cupin superfamily)